MAARARVVHRGITLIELLIAMSILALIMALASYGFSLFAGYWERSRGSFEQSSARLQRLSLVIHSVEASVPWLVKDAQNDIGFYFLGREEGFTFVTTEPVFSSQGMAVVRLFRERESMGRFRLVYEEAPLMGINLERADQVLPFAHRLVVLSNLRSLSFRYFGYTSAANRGLGMDDERAIEASAQWLTKFDGLEAGLNPMKVGISLDGAEFRFELPATGDVSAARASDPI
jgi:prepilin-type N-terminal cleavage/methylation domain-containing protein